MSDPNAPAGWYPDTTSPGRQRYWDGSAWTEHFHEDPVTPENPVTPHSTVTPAVAAPPVGGHPVGGQPVPGFARPPRSRRGLVIGLTLGGVAFVTVLVVTIVLVLQAVDRSRRTEAFCANLASDYTLPSDLVAARDRTEVYIDRILNENTYSSTEQSALSSELSFLAIRVSTVTGSVQVREEHAYRRLADLQNDLVNGSASIAEMDSRMEADMFWDRLYLDGLQSDLDALCF